MTDARYDFNTAEGADNNGYGAARAGWALSDNPYGVANPLHQVWADAHDRYHAEHPADTAVQMTFDDEGGWLVIPAYEIGLHH